MRPPVENIPDQPQVIVLSLSLSLFHGQAKQTLSELALRSFHTATKAGKKGTPRTTDEVFLGHDGVTNEASLWQRK